MEQRNWQVGGQVMSEVLDGEAVIIDMASGRYHAASGVAATVWQAISAGLTFDGILSEVGRRHSGLPVNAADAIDLFIKQLVDANLVTQGVTGGETPVNSDDPSGQTTAWAPPVLESHDDLQDLLLLDPVHEVTEAGWPHAAQPDA